MSRSIMQEDNGVCYLCRMLNGDDWPKPFTHEHHIFPASNRKASEHYGLKVYLCLAHHTEGPEAVHSNIKNMRLLQAAGQKAFERYYPELNFREIFGRNYIYDGSREISG